MIKNRCRDKEPELLIHHLFKQIGGSTILSDIHIRVAKGECLCLLGPSGCGKTTLLRIIAGLDQPDDGHVFFNGRNINGVPPFQRNFSMMFQDFALFPHRNVSDNISFSLEMKNIRKPFIRHRVKEMLALVGLTGYDRRPIDSLSGGECQRVALARALAGEPECILLDEPLGALDRLLKQRLLEDLVTILKQIDTTVIYVTHDQGEAFYAGDRICLLNRGRVEQIASPRDLYSDPVSEYAARFLGFKNIFPCRTVPPDSVETGFGRFTLRKKIGPFLSETSCRLLILPEFGTVVENSEGNGHNILKGRVAQVVFREGFFDVDVLTQTGESVRFSLHRSCVQNLDTGCDITLKIEADGLRVFE